MYLFSHSAEMVSISGVANAFPGGHQEDHTKMEKIRGKLREKLQENEEN